MRNPFAKERPPPKEDEVKVTPLPQAEPQHNTEDTTELFNLLEEEGLLERVGIKEPRDLENRNPSTPESEKASLLETRTNIQFSTYPHPDSDIQTTLDEPLVILNLADVKTALASIDSSKRATQANHIFTQLRNNNLIANLKRASGEVTLYRWASQTEHNYGGVTNQDLPIEGFDQHPNSPATWWRVPVEGHVYNVNQWKSGDKKLFVKPVAELEQEGVIAADVIDPDSVVFLQT